ncbi:uncharacterized protein BXIN_2453 [Babesia sp. Xinjiang]|uniref:uncharacterized protein n=1 Tax=Babesia sp. Xinjiang TaxID=462227 RepID=UPI000A2335D8|nr:uncharacterized protein BXIN_2453 [Babesia sp. Xinjiang]ORM41431.1 hypothetical protein BXIN_2453 [Babesia sp. Xinjiang]
MVGYKISNLIVGLVAVASLFGSNVLGNETPAENNSDWKPAEPLRKELTNEEIDKLICHDVRFGWWTRRGKTPEQLKKMIENELECRRMRMRLSIQHFDDVLRRLPADLAGQAAEYPTMRHVPEALRQEIDAFFAKQQSDDLIAREQRRKEYAAAEAEAKAKAAPKVLNDVTGVSEKHPEEGKETSEKTDETAKETDETTNETSTEGSETPEKSE